MLDFFDTKTAMILLHVFGAVIGGGGAFMADAMFFSAMDDRKLSATELRFLRLASGMVWAGVGILLLSGIGIVMSDPVHYFASDKFLAKMLIVLVIVVNGVIFHLCHLPLFHRCHSMRLSESAEFMARRKWILVSGVISLVSWCATIILGSLSKLPWSFEGIMVVYGATLLTVILFAVSFNDRIIVTHPRARRR